MEALLNLGIDWRGVLMYLVNFGILIAILTKLLYRPITDAVEQRRSIIAQNLNEAEEIKKTFEKEFARKQAEFDDAMKRMEQEVIAAKRSAEERAEEILAEADRKRTKMIQDARVIIGQMKEDIQKDIEQDVRSKIERVVLAILKDSVPADVVTRSVEQEWKSLN